MYAIDYLSSRTATQQPSAPRNLTRSGTKIKRLLWAPGQGEEFPTAI